MRARRHDAGLTLIEVMIVMAITLSLGLIVYRLTSSTWQAYRLLTHQAERGISGTRALDDMAVEIARAGFGLTGDVAAIWPAMPGGLPAPDGITLRSNPGGGFAFREVAFGLRTDRTGAVALVRRASGQAEQVLVRHVGLLRFEYLDEEGNAVAPPLVALGAELRAVRVVVGLVPDPGAPPVALPHLSLVVPVERQNATVTFGFSGPILDRVGLAAVIGQEPGATRKTVRVQAWRKSAGAF